MKWQWNGTIWIPNAGPCLAPPGAPGAFVGQTYDDVTGESTTSQVLVQVLQTYQRSQTLTSRVMVNAFNPVFATGLAAAEVQNYFLTVVQKVRTSRETISRLWLSNPERVFQILMQPVTNALAKVGVPVAPTYTLIKSAHKSGSFAWETWNMEVNRDALDQMFRAADEPTFVRYLGNLANTLYHEARHAEQMFRILRFLSSTGLTERQIASITGITPHIVGIAGLTPLRLPERGWTPESMEAMRWFQSVFGTYAGERRNTLRYMAEAKQYEAELQIQFQVYKSQLYLAGSKEEREEIGDNMKKLIPFIAEAGHFVADATDGYMAFPEEVDAWSVGGNAEFHHRYAK